MVVLVPKKGARSRDAVISTARIDMPEKNVRPSTRGTRVLLVASPTRAAVGSVGAWTETGDCVSMAVLLAVMAGSFVRADLAYSAVSSPRLDRAIGGQ